MTLSQVIFTAAPYVAGIVHCARHCSVDREAEMIPLHTCAVCDECGTPATVEIEPGFFLCDRHAAILADSVAEVSSFPSVSAATVSQPPAVAAINSRDGASFSPGPSLATGMSSDPANAGGEHEEIAPFSNEHDQICIELETGTSPGACGTERELVGALNSHCEPEQLEITGDRMRELAPQQARRPSQLTPFDRNSDPIPFTLPPGSETSAARSDTEASSLSSFVDPGACGFDFEAAISALEARWRAEQGAPPIARNANTFRVVASNDSVSKSISVSE